MRQRLAADAADLRLPASPADLPADRDGAEPTITMPRSGLAQAVHELRLALPESAAAAQPRERRRAMI